MLVAVTGGIGLSLLAVATLPEAARFINRR